MRRIPDYLYLLPIPIVALSFILINLTNDSLIFLGVARLADYYGPFPSNIDAAWEMKPLGNRLINYLLYKAGTLFTEFGSPEFAIAVKLIAVLFALACCWYFARSFSLSSRVPIFSVTTLAMLTVTTFIGMQAEWFSVLFCLIAVALLRERGYLHAYVFAGVLLFFAALIKGVTGILLVTVLAFIYLSDKRSFVFNDRLKFAIIGFFSAGLVFLAMCLTIFPHAIPDMLMASALARVGQLPLDTMILSLLAPLPTIELYIPAALFSAFCGIYLLASGKLKGWDLAAYAAMWAAPFVIVLVTSEFFLYHYFPLVLPGIFSLILLCREVKDWRIPAGAVLSMLVLWLAFTSYFGIISQAEIQFFDKQGYPKEADALFNISNESSVLFLDPGSAPFYFRTNTSCRYSTPMPVQRHTKDWNVSYLPAYAEQYQCIAAYNGTFIIGLDRWFGKDLKEREEIYRKIDRDYTKVWNKSWDIYRRNFPIPTPTSTAMNVYA